MGVAEAGADIGTDRPEWRVRIGDDAFGGSVTDDDQPRSGHQLTHVELTVSAI
jgi:hypothetical protein